MELLTPYSSTFLFICTFTSNLLPVFRNIAVAHMDVSTFSSTYVESRFGSKTLQIMQTDSCKERYSTTLLGSAAKQKVAQPTRRYDGTSLRFRILTVKIQNVVECFFDLDLLERNLSNASEIDDPPQKNTKIFMIGAISPPSLCDQP